MSVASTSKPVVERKPKSQGKYSADKELDKMVREIQSNRIKVNLSKQMQANLDSLDDPIPTLDKSESPISDASNSSQNQIPAVKPFGNVLAVVHRLTKDKKARKSVTFDEVLTTMFLVRGEKNIADSNRG